MTETKVILVADPKKVPWDKKKLKVEDGVRLVHCDGAFDALDELVSDGASAIISTTSLPDMSGFQLCAFIKTSLGLMSLPVGLVHCDDEDSEIRGAFWSTAAMPDEIVGQAEVSGDEESLGVLIANLVGLSNDMGWNPENASGYFDDPLNSRDVLKSYGNLVDDLLTARLVTGVIRMLSVAAQSKLEFLESFFRLTGALAPADAIGVVLNGASPWAVLKVSDRVNVTESDTIRDSVLQELSFAGDLEFTLSAGEENNGKDSIESFEVFPLYSQEGLLGALIIGTCDGDGFEPALLRFYEGLGNDLATIYGLLASREKVSVLEKQATYSASADSLTGLYNLEFLIGFLQQQLLFSFRQRLPVGLAIVDIDGLADINQEHGTDIGDFVLTSVANRLLNITRSSDLVARYSGDEFAVVLPNTDGDGARVLAEKVRTAIEGHSFSPDGSSAGPKVTVSIGCAMFNMEDLNPETILRDAKVALQKAKENGPNSISLDGTGEQG